MPFAFEASQIKKYRIAGKLKALLDLERLIVRTFVFQESSLNVVNYPDKQKQPARTYIRNAFHNQGIRSIFFGFDDLLIFVHISNIIFL